MIHSQAAAAASRTENRKVTKPESSSSPNRFPSKSPWARMFHTDWIPGSSVPEIQSHTAEIAGQIHSCHTETTILPNSWTLSRKPSLRWYSR